MQFKKKPHLNVLFIRVKKEITVLILNGKEAYNAQNLKFHIDIEGTVV